MKKQEKKTAVDRHLSPTLRSMAVPIGTLVSDTDNVRTHPQRNLDAIRASLQRFGQQAPVVYVMRGKQRVVIKGNGLLAAAQTLGWSHLVAVQSGLAGDDAKAYAIADNRTTDLSQFDESLLAAQLQELEEADFDLAAAGFTDEELQQLVEDVDEPKGRPIRTAAGGSRKRGERTALFLVGHFKFEIPRKEFDHWLSGLEAKVGNDPDRIVGEIKRRLKVART